MPTVLECLTHCPNPYYTQTLSTTVSTKQNAVNLPELLRDFHRDGTTMFTADLTSDNSRYNRILPGLPSAVTSEVHNEGDVRRVFAYITSWVEQAFDVVPKVWHRWEAGPPGLGITTPETIDTWWGVYLGQHQRCAAIGELKRPGVIVKDEWYRPNPKADTVRLGKEMRITHFNINARKHLFLMEIIYLSHAFELKIVLMTFATKIVTSIVCLYRRSLMIYLIGLTV